jgi:ATP-dependent DNA ligase
MGLHVDDGEALRAAIEVVANNAKGMPDFAALHGRAAKPEDFCAWAFDLLELNGANVRSQQLLTRRAKLQKLITRFDRPSRAVQVGRALAIKP